MVVGSTGSGKTTTVNAMINHVLGVQWKDDFRLKIIHELSSNQGAGTIRKKSTQSNIVRILLHSTVHGRIQNTLQPHYRGHSGLWRFKRNWAPNRYVDSSTQRARQALIMLMPSASLVRPVIRGSLPRSSMFLTESWPCSEKISRRISISALYLCWWSRASNPVSNASSRSLVANSGEEDEDNFDRMFWRMGIKSFEKFLQDLAKMEPKSLFLTKQVLNERAQLEVRLSGLRETIDLGVNKLSELQQSKRVCNQHAADINANKNFIFTHQEPKRVHVNYLIIF